MAMQHDFPERRLSPRYPIRVPLGIRINGEQGEKGPLRSQTGDLSEGGLSFRWAEGLEVGTPVEVLLPVEDLRFAIQGAVARCSEENSGFRVGLAFRDPTQAFRLKLGEQMARIAELRNELTLIRGREVSLEEAARDWVDFCAEKFAEVYAAA
jgi:hypothetical protein